MSISLPGPGEWEAASGIDALGIEWDADACATSLAAGLRTLEADVASLDPLDFAPCVGLIASAPCQAFSNAGLGAGRAAMAAYEAAIVCMAEDRPVNWDAIRGLSSDERGHLVLEPLRWALALRPRWIALEQVEPVMPLWQAMATALRGKGYSAWCRVLSAERYGVPQTRRRAILIASLDREVCEPAPTHQRYIAPKRRDEATDALFAAPEPERIVVPEDAHLLPWVSMAEALGWGMTARPSVALLAKVGGTGGHRPLEGGSGARATLDRAREDGYWTEGPAPAPAPTVTAGGGEHGGIEVFASKAARARAAGAVRFVANSREHATARASDEPAPTITAGHDSAERRWELRAGTNDNDASRALDEPAPTIRYGDRLNDVSWVADEISLRTGNFTARDHRGQRGVPYEREASEPAPTIRAANAGEWVQTDNVTADGTEKYRRATDQPAPTLTSRADLWKVGSDAPACGCLWEHVDEGGFCACCHAHLDDPNGLYAAQGDGTHHLSGCPQFTAPTHYDRRQSERAGVVPRPTGDPAPTLCAEKLAKGVDVWTTERPSTTVNCDPRVAEPGRDDPAQPGSQYGAATVRVSIQEAAVLQSFPPDWPWQGTKTARFRQVGNAIPPLLAWHVLKAVGAIDAGASA